MSMGWPKNLTMAQKNTIKKMAWKKSLYFRYINACKGRRRNLRDLAWIMLKEDLAHREKSKGEEVETSQGARGKIDQIF
jgi:hypothetical protein